MRSRTSWFNATLFKKNCTRFWPIWSAYALLWAFILPLQLLNRPSITDSFFSDFANADVLASIDATVFTAAAAAILAVMAVFSYLYNNRSAGMIHALPVRREELFLTNYFSGLAFLAVPAVAVFLLTLGAEAIAGYVNAGALCMWLVVHLLVILFFYSFAVFCAMFTGNILALPAFFGILNFLAYMVFTMIDGLLRQFLYGYAGSDWMSDSAIWLTPVIRYVQDFNINRTYAEDGFTLLSAQFVGLGTALIFAGVGLLLAVAALVIYRRRALETAGDVVSVSWVRPIFKYGVAVSAALVGGMALYSLFGYNLLGESMWGVLIWLLPCGAIGCFGAQMLLDKTFRVFSKWKGCLVLLAGLSLCMGLIHLDPIGFTRWIPDPGTVTSLTFYIPDTASYDSNNSDAEYTSPEEIALAMEFHQGLVAQRDQVAERRRQEQEQLRQGVDYLDGPNLSSAELRYELVDGRTIYRRFSYLVDEAQLEDSASPAAQLTTLLNLPGQETRYEFPTSDKVRLVAIDLPVFNRNTWVETNVSVPNEGLEEVYAAVQSDLAAGRLGRRYLMNTDERLNNCYYNDLTFTFYSPEGGAAFYPDLTAAELRQTGRWDRKDWQVTVTLQSTATDTLAALRRLGVLSDSQTLTTQAEYRAWQEQENRKYED